jgi:hypothetical protein
MILAELSRADREDTLSLKELRRKAKQSVDELAKDPRVEKILRRDPEVRLTWNERKLAEFEEAVKATGKLFGFEPTLAEWVSGVDLTGILHEGTLNMIGEQGEWKRDHCAHYNGQICTKWFWKEPPNENCMTQEDGKWRLRVSERPAYCSACPVFRTRSAGDLEGDLEAAWS